MGPAGREPLGPSAAGGGLQGIRAVLEEAASWQTGVWLRLWLWLWLWASVEG